MKESLVDQAEKLYEGKAKIVFKAPDGSLLHYFKDSATAFNAQKKAEFDGKGRLNTAFTTLVFGHLKSKGIPTHLLETIDERTIRTLALKMLPVEVVVRNRMAGSLARRLGEKEGSELHPPLLEWYLKDDAKGDPQVSEDLLIGYFKQSPEILKEVKKLALQVNEILRPLFEKVGLILADFKLEFGQDLQGKVYLADEFSPDTSRLWDSKTLEKFDKDRFRFDLGDLMTGYREVLRRLEEGMKS